MHMTIRVAIIASLVLLAPLFAQAPGQPDPRIPVWLDPNREEPAGTRYRTFFSKTTSQEVSYLIYLPPGYETSPPERRYPVLYWLHGGGGNQRVGGDFVKLAAETIESGHCPSMVIVLVNGLPSSLYNDSRDGQRPVETVIVRELIPHIDATYRTIAHRSSRAIEGFSMGGYGAAHLGFKYPELFGAISNLAGAVIDVDFFATYQSGRILNHVFNGDREAFQRNHPFTLAENNANLLRGRTNIRLVVGEQDTGRGTYDANVKLHELLDRLKIGHDFFVPRDVRHNYRAIYAALGKDAFAFYRQAFSGPDPLPEPPVCYDVGQVHRDDARNARNVEPFHIMDGLFYVGNSQVSSHLLTSTDGLILIDTPMPHEAAWLVENIRKLGFDPRDIKVVIGGHAHLDHIGAHAWLQQHVGAQTWLHEMDAPATSKGRCKAGAKIELDGTLPTLAAAFPPFKVDRLLTDGETIQWGGRTLTFHRAPGHTRGTLFIEFPLKDKGGRVLQAGYLGGLAPGREEFTETAKRLLAKKVDLWIASHPSQNGTLDKGRRLLAGEEGNPFVDPGGWQNFLQRMLRAGDKKR